MADEHPQFNRRKDDERIYQMHGMLSTLVQTMSDHIAKDDAAHARLKVVEDDMGPVKRFFEWIKLLGKAAMVAATPVLLGIGTALWIWFQHIVPRIAAVKAVP